MPKPTTKPGGKNAAPEVADQTFAIDENSASSSIVGAVLATDPEGDSLTYSIVGGNDDGAFAIDAATGEITVADGTPLDHEAAAERTLEVAVSDGDKTSEATITITIEDVNEAPTSVSIDSETLDPGTDGAVVGTLSVADPDDPATANGQHEFSVSDARFEVMDGVLKLKAREALAEGETVSVEVTATDGGGLTVSETFDLTATATPFSGVVDLGALDPAAGFTVSGVTGTGFGGVVSAAGDVNGDGIDDFLIQDGSGLPSVYLIYGRAGGFTDFTMADLIRPEDGIRVSNASESNDGGWGIGDVNNDGLADFAIASSFGTSSTVSVIYGKAGGYAGDIDFLDLDPGDGFIISGPAGNTGSFAFGGAVDAAGDVNGDGIGDFIIGDATGDGSSRRGSQAGDAFIVFGKDSTQGAGFSDFSIDSLQAGDGFRILGANVVDQVGFSVSSAGDLNDDGFDDVIVGAVGARVDGKGANGGEGISYVVYGSATPGDIDLDWLSAQDGFRILGADSGDNMGVTVSEAGDVNGDGIDDIMVGANRAAGEDNLETWAGEAFIIYGSTDGFSDIEVGTLTPDRGIRIIGADANDFTGLKSLVAAGDVNGDGHADVLISADRGDGAGNTAEDSGEVYLIWGGAGLTDMDLGNFTAADGILFLGADAGDQAGWSVSSAGDIDDDGLNDLLIGAPFGDEAYVIYGSADFFA